MLPFTIGLTGRVLSIFPSKLTAFPHTIQYLQAALSCALQRQQHLPQLLWLPAETLSSGGDMDAAFGRRAVAFFTARLYSNMPCLLGFYATNWRNLGSFNDYFFFLVGIYFHGEIFTTRKQKVSKVPVVSGPRAIRWRDGSCHRRNSRGSGWKLMSITIHDFRRK